MTTTHDHDTAAQPTAELPPFVFVPPFDRSDTDLTGTPPPSVEEAARPRRWSTGHTVAAAIVAVGVLASGGAALAARDGSTGTGTDGVPGAPGGVAPGLGQQNQQAPQGTLPGAQLPGGQLPGQQQGQLGGPFGDHDHDGFPGGQLPGSTSDGIDGSDSSTGTTGTVGTTTGSVTT